MLTIHKWLLDPRPGPSEACMMPQNAEIVSVRGQGHVIAIWARINTDDAAVPRRFIVCETGKECPPGRYLGVAMFGGGALVLHVFEDGP